MIELTEVERNWLHAMPIWTDADDIKIEEKFDILEQQVELMHQAIRDSEKRLETAGDEVRRLEAELQKRPKHSDQVIGGRTSGVGDRDY